jgi:uncharacterized protein (DUF1330 family)
MTTYLIAEIEVTDPAAFEEYRAGVPAVIARYGGSYLVRGGELETLESDWQPSRITVLAFPDRAALKRFYDSDDYRDLKALRIKSTNSRVICVDGV